MIKPVSSSTVQHNPWNRCAALEWRSACEGWRLLRGGLSTSPPIGVPVCSGEVVDKATKNLKLYLCLSAFVSVSVLAEPYLEVVPKLFANVIG